MLNDMRPELQALLRAVDGLFTREQLLAATDHNVLDRAVGRGSLVRLLPRSYTTPALALDPRIRVVRPWPSPDRMLL